MYSGVATAKLRLRRLVAERVKGKLRAGGNWEYKEELRISPLD